MENSDHLDPEPQACPLDDPCPYCSTLSRQAVNVRVWAKVNSEDWWPGKIVEEGLTNYVPKQKVRPYHNMT